jgi:2-amino-4-hydroxy-6-hydroxymethyldihydropteridine diphosphokinase
MRYNEWKLLYKKIINDLELNFKDDEKSAYLLDSTLKKKQIVDLKKIENLIKNKEIIVLAAGPSLEKSIKRHKKNIGENITIAADGATSALIENNIIPDIIVSDLDGCVSDQITANAKGSIIVIHAHGDNIDSLKKYVEAFPGRIIGTTQIDPSSFKELYNFGGFTDGDRAVFLAEHFKAKKISLMSFDFNGKIGKYSLPDRKNIDMKLRKLKWCEKLIVYLNKKNNNIQFLNSL